MIKLKENLIKYKYYLLMLSIFIISRLLVLLNGISFDASSLTYFWQYLEEDILKNNLLESLYYLHGQPPLFNLFLGIGLKLFPENYIYFFQGSYLLMSLSIYFILYYLFTSYKIKPIWSVLFATVFIISPEVIIYENWLFYTWFVSFLLALTLLFIRKYSVTLNPKYALYFMISISAIGLTRTSFHLVLVVSSIIIILFITNKNRRKIIMYSLIPIILIFGLYTKNFILFDTFGSSSWLGMNIFKIASPSAKEVSIEQLYNNKKISKLPLIGEFKEIKLYPKKYTMVPKKYQNIKILNEPYKTNGVVNYNYYGYIKVSKILEKDSIVILKNNLNTYLENIVQSWSVYSRPSFTYMFVRGNYFNLKKYIDIVTFQKLREPLKINKVTEKFEYPFSTLVLIPVTLMLIFLYFIMHIFNGYNSKKIDPTLVYMFLIIFALSFIGNAIEMGENQRFRVIIDPFIYTFVIIILFSSKGKKEVLK